MIATQSEQNRLRINEQAAHRHRQTERRDPQLFTQEDIMHYTVSQIKDELPDVDVLYSGKRIACRIAGRDNLFASVILPNALSVEVAWSTLANVLNTGRAVRL